MDPQKMKEAYQRLELLDDRLSYKIRPKKRSMVQPTPDQINSSMKDLSEYVLELKDILREFMLSFASKPKGRGQGQAQEQAQEQGPPQRAPGAPGAPGSGPPPPPTGEAPGG